MDQALPQNKIHPNVSFCGGLPAVLNKSDCIGFNLSITDNRVVVTPSGSGGSGGGGGGASPSCYPKWTCISWNECKRSDDALGLGVLSGFEYRNIQDDCVLLGIKSEKCGFQIRSCQDFGACNLSSVPPVKQSCEYSSTYTCYDGIKNCHDGGCEFLVDCGGGICDQCPTCSDGIQNQGEQGIDCSGPCPRQCSVELPSIGLSILSIASIVTLIVLVGIVIFRFLRVQKLTESV